MQDKSLLRSIQGAKNGNKIYVNKNHFQGQFKL